MIRVSQAYAQACEESERTSYIVARYGYKNEEQKQAISRIEMDAMSFTPTSNVNNNIIESYNYISGEPNRVTLDGSYYFLYSNETPNDSQSIGCWSQVMSREDCYFDTNPTLTIYLNKVFNTTSMALAFQEICSEFKVKYFTSMPSLDVNAKKIVHIKNNSEKVVEIRQDETDNFLFACIQIEFIKTREPYRYIKFNEIDFGAQGEFNNQDISDYNIINETSADSSSIPSNYLELTIVDKEGIYDSLNPDNDLFYLKLANSITLYHYLKVGKSIKEIPLGNCNIENITHANGKTKIMGYDKLYYYKDTYYGSKFYENYENGFVKNVYDDFFNYYGITDYELDSALLDENIPENYLDGYVKPLKFKDALQTILQATGCIVVVDNYGKIKIKKMSAQKPIKKFKRNLIFKESFDSRESVYNYDINVINYNEDYKETNITLFQGTLDAGRHTIYFENYPVKSGSIEIYGATTYRIEKESATYCVIYLNGRHTIEIEGKIVTASSKIETVINDSKSSQKKVINNSLISRQNYYAIKDFLTKPTLLKCNFDTKVMPYIEIGDIITYESKYGKNYQFTISKIEYTKSLIQSFEGV